MMFWWEERPELCLCFHSICEVSDKFILGVQGFFGHSVIFLNLSLCHTSLLIFLSEQGGIYSYSGSMCCRFWVIRFG